MPMREFGCTVCQTVTEIYHPSLDPARVPRPKCSCGKKMDILYSVPRIDTSSTFHPFDYQDPITNTTIHIDNLHKLRAVEHASLASGRNVRFDAYSAEPSNPDSVDGFGGEYWDGTANYDTGKTTMLPTMRK